MAYKIDDDPLGDRTYILSELIDKARFGQIKPETWLIDDGGLRLRASKVHELNRIFDPAAEPETEAPVVETDTKTCPFCAETIKAAAIVCKHCGRDLVKPVSPPVQEERVPPHIRALRAENPIRQNYQPDVPTPAPAPKQQTNGCAIAFVCVAALFAIGSCVGSMDGNSSGTHGYSIPPDETPAITTPTIDTGYTSPKVDLTVVKTNAVASNGIGQPGFVGVVRNDSGRDLSYAEVHIEFLDKKGTIVGTGWDNESGIPAGKTWNFDVTWPDGIGAKSARLLDATGQ